MKMQYRNTLLAITLVVLSTQSLASINITGNSAEVVKLRQNCSGISNCATTFSELLDWTWNTRQPNAINPLTIDIGPGIFPLIRYVNNEPFPLNLCSNGGHVSFKGAGQGITTIGGIGKPYGQAFNIGTKYHSSVGIIDCNKLSFQDMTISSDVASGNGVYSVHHGVGWFGGGDSTWTNVSIEASNYAWIDTCLSNTGQVPGNHVWFGSSIKSISATNYYNIGYASTCGNSSFYGGEIFSIKEAAAVTPGTLVAVAAKGNQASINIYGSLIRSIGMPNSIGMGVFSSGNTIALGQGGIVAMDGAVVHMHGGIISVLSNSSANSSLFGVAASNGGMVHTPDTAFGMRPAGTGSAIRVINNGATIHSPFMWPEDSVPPSITSVTGADVFVETDCSSTGCQTTGDQPHMLIYSEACGNNGSSPWFDIVTSSCR